MKKFICMISILVFMCMFSFCSFAITPLSSFSMQTFDSGPWNGQRAAFGKVSSNGSLSNYGVPSWRDGSGLGEAYYRASGNVGYIFSNDSTFNNVCIVSSDPLQELFAVDRHGNQLVNLLSDAFIIDNGSKYFYGVTIGYGSGLAYSSDASEIYITEFSPSFNGGGYHDLVANNLPYVSGIFDGNSQALRYPGLVQDLYQSTSLTYGYDYMYFPCVCLGVNNVNVWGFYFRMPDGVLNVDSKYTFNFDTFNFSKVDIWSIGLSTDFLSSRAGSTISVSVDGYDSVITDLLFRAWVENQGCDLMYLRYASSNSDDIGTIPPDDTDGDGSASPDYSSALSTIGNSIKELQSKLSAGTTTIVNNITNQTTQITNTITNTVSNMSQQITQGLQSVQQGITDKLGQVQDGINDKLESVQDEIVNGFDNSGIEQNGNELDSSITEFEEAEQNVLESVNDSLNDFEFDADLSEYKNIVQVISDFLQELYDSSGGFKLVINLSLMLSVASIVIGVYRFKEGG